MIRRLPFTAAWDALPPEEEEEETDEERALVEETRADLAAGRAVPWEKLSRRYR